MTGPGPVLLDPFAGSGGFWLSRDVRAVLPPLLRGCA